MNNSKKSNGSRNRKGSSMSEFAPSLFILLIFLTFPMFDLIGFGATYFCGYTLNSLQLREAAVTPASQALRPSGVIKKDLPERFSKTGLGAFAQVINVKTDVSYLAGHKDPRSEFAADATVSVSTEITSRPFLTIPFFTGIPGLGSPFTLKFASTRPLEDPNFVRS